MPCLVAMPTLPSRLCCTVLLMQCRMLGPLEGPHRRMVLPGRSAPRCYYTAPPLAVSPGGTRADWNMGWAHRPACHPAGCKLSAIPRSRGLHARTVHSPQDLPAGMHAAASGPLPVPVSPARGCDRAHWPGGPSQLSWVSASQPGSFHIFNESQQFPANADFKPLSFLSVGTKQQSRLKYSQSLMSICLRLLVQHSFSIRALPLRSRAEPRGRRLGTGDSFPRSWMPTGQPRGPGPGPRAASFGARK